MAKPSQHQQEPSESKRSGGGQAVVELCEASAGGLVFWSRQRFDIGAELQIRIRRDALPCELNQSPASEADDWITVSGFVVECPAIRRPDGAHGFRVSLLLESALTPGVPHRRKVQRRLRYVESRFPAMARLGLN